MTETRQITFTGSGPHARALVQMLQAEGVEVALPRRGRPSTERRDAQAIAEAVVATLLATGTIEAIKAGVRKFRTRFPGVKVEFGDEDD